MKDDLIVFCDASCKNDYCGIGICVLSPNGKLIDSFSKRLSGFRKNNTAAEARAVCEAVAYGIKKGAKSIRVYSDSISLSAVVSRKKARSPLMKEFLEAINVLSRSIKITLKYVRGHAKSRWNNMCDHLARKAKFSTFEKLINSVFPKKSPDLWPPIREACSYFS